jgi:CubicO group peptidase (beta-lactamase class C family)
VDFRANAAALFTHSYRRPAMSKRFALLLCSLLSMPAFAQVPASGARQVLDEWLEAFNSGDRAQMEAFGTRHDQKQPLEELLQFRKNTGGFRLIRIESEAPEKATALVQEAESDTVARMEVVLSEPGAASAPPRIQLRVIPRPDDLRIPRMDQAAALASLGAHADTAAAKDTFAGALLVARGDEVLLQRAWGETDRGAGKPNGVETQFRLGSANKMFTAVAVLQLVQAGKLSLDDTVGKWLPSYPNTDIASKVTVRHLLGHSGGTGDFFGPEFDANRLSLRTHDDYIRLFGERAPEHAPGAEHRYSNYGFILLGAIIERVSGQDYYAYVRDHVFKPAGMTRTDSLPEEQAVPGRAIAYTRREGAWVDASDTLPYRGTAAGGGYSTVGDLHRFGQALIEGRLVSPELLAEATTVHGPNYGYGFNIQSEGGLHGFGHGGGAPGMNAEFRVYPASRVILVGLGNVDPPAVERLVRHYALRMPATVAD